MDNFTKATKIIKEYRKLRLDREAKNNFGLHSKLAEIGYTPESWKQENEDREFKKYKFQIKEVIPSTILENIVSSDSPTLLINKERCVYVGTDGYNEEYCKDIEVVKMGYGGGTIVTTGDDLGLLFILDKPELNSYIQSKIDNRIKGNINGNDIILDGYKVCGGAYKQIGDKHLYYYQISFRVDLDMIRNICTKEMKKEPKGISEISDKTRDDLLAYINEWLQQ